MSRRQGVNHSTRACAREVFCLTSRFVYQRKKLVIMVEIEGKKGGIAKSRRGSMNRLLPNKKRSLRCRIRTLTQDVC